MEQNSTRLHSLDGLRGLAMLLVFLNHINPTYIIAAFPILDKIGLFSSGVSGVSFFFILSGFLMAYLYPHPQDNFQFLQKRYTRIFPLFLTMCALMLLFSVYPNLAWPLQIGSIILLAFIVNIIWVKVIKKIPNKYISKALFFTFLSLQIIVGCFYGFWIMRHPPAYFQQFPQVFKNLIVGLVNGTLTFSLGNYIPMLDGVYWSLASEILFYALYPFFIVPLIIMLSLQKRPVKILFLLALLPLFAGIDMLSSHIFDLKALQFTLFYYFPGGILLGYLYRKRSHLFSVFSDIFKGKFAYFPVLLLFAALIGENYLNFLLPNAYSPWIRLFFMFPFTFVVALALNKETTLYKFLSSKILVYIGAISYSLYLSHTAVIHMALAFHQATSLPEDFYFIIITLFVSILLSSLLYFLLEKPYFIPNRKHDVKKISVARPAFISGKSVILVFMGIYFVAIFLAFQSQFNVFSLIVNNFSKYSAPKGTNGGIYSLKNKPTITFTIQASENNFGIVALSVRHIKSDNKTPDNPTLLFTLTQESNSKTLVTVPYVLDEFRGVDFPFGFPVISDSKGKIYKASFTLVPPSKSNYVTIDPTTLKSVYQLKKVELIKNPRELIKLIYSKVLNVFENPLSSLTLLLFLPFFAIAVFMLIYPGPKGVIKSA